MTKIVAICGSLRAQSSNRALLAAAAALAPDGVEVTLYDGLASLPHFNPDDDAEGAAQPAAVTELRTLLAEADGVLISSPEYAHGVPGSMKNALDWLVSAGELVGTPVVLLRASPVGGEYAQASLTETLETMNWKVLATLATRKKVRDGQIDEAIAAVVREALEILRNGA
jgi:NAD(P)H-dependent FMN reductase